jgi:hypothetical protein
VVVTAGVLFRWLLDPWLVVAQPLATPCGSVAVAVWYGGYRPGLVAALGYLPATRCKEVFKWSSIFLPAM